MREWLYEKLKEYRNTEDLNKKLDILREIIKSGYKKDIYLKRIVKTLVEAQKYSEAVRVFEDIKEKDTIDLSLMVRSLSYLGKFEDAKGYIDKILAMPDLGYNLPRVLSHLSIYYFLHNKAKEGLELFNSYVKDVISTSFSPRSLASFYNYLALLNSANDNVETALNFYNLALDYARRTNNSQILYRIANNYGDLARYIYGPKVSVKYSLEAYELTKKLSNSFGVVALGNLINGKVQFCSSTEIESMLEELERMLKDTDIEYYLYIGYRRLALVNLCYHRFEEVERFIPYLKNIKSIQEKDVLIKILKGYLGEDIDLLSLEDDVLNTKEIQIILIYLRLLLEKGLTPKKITKSFYSEYPFYQFMKALIEEKELSLLLTYIDFMTKRWEYLDALNSYLLLIKTSKAQENSKALELSCFEAMNLSYLLNLNSITEYLKREISTNGFPVWEYMMTRISEYYFREAIINSENEEQAIRLIYEVLSKHLDDFLVRIEVASKSIEEGNTLLDIECEKFRYENSPFSITLYSKKEPSPLVLTLLRSFLNAFIIFWDRRYGMYDPLTGLLNRAYGIKKIEELFIEYKRNKELFSVVFIDVNSLKKINDTMGHSYGDLVLQKIADCIKSSIRQNDYAIRWGGDEFLVLLKNVDYYNAEKILKKIDGKVTVASNGKFSVSYGLETISEDISDYNQLIDLADVKMYANKHSKKVNSQTFIQ